MHGLLHAGGQNAFCVFFGLLGRYLYPDLFIFSLFVVVYR